MVLSSRLRRSYGCAQAIVLLLSCCCCCSSVEAEDKNNANKNAMKGVDEFLTSLTQMIGSVLSSDARYSQVLGGMDDDVLQSISGRPNGLPSAADYFDTGRPPFLVSRPPPPYLENGRPYPSPDLPLNSRPGFLGSGRPPYPYEPGFQPGPNRYPQQNSIIQALSSISQHDDLMCVPRLLCEVSSGTRPSSGYYQQPGYYQQQQQQQQSSIPFLSKDALITLLTVLNFVDDSPLLMFGRAALLGYNARGDPKSCVTAYPTCPRDPDQLINYLNNHNGGFFRFFNQQLPQYAPQYATHQQPPYPQRPLNLQRPPYPQRPLYPSQSSSRPGPYYPNQQYASQYQQPQQYFGNGFKGRADSGSTDRLAAPRILSGSPSQLYDVPSVQDLALDVPTRRPHNMVFPSDQGHENAAALPFVFPTGDNDATGAHRQGKRLKMIFPDRTGTGGLRAELDQYGNYKGVYYADGNVKFNDENDVRDGNARPSRVVLDQAAASNRPADRFNVGERPPYVRRQKVFFPASS